MCAVVIASACVGDVSTVAPDPVSVAPSATDLIALDARLGWVSDAICLDGCQQDSLPLTAAMLLETIARLESTASATGSAPSRVSVPLCGDPCEDRLLTKSDLRIALWRWLGGPGQILSVPYQLDDDSIATAFWTTFA